MVTKVIPWPDFNSGPAETLNNSPISSGSPVAQSDPSRPNVCTGTSSRFVEARTKIGIAGYIGSVIIVAAIVLLLTLIALTSLSVRLLTRGRFRTVR